MAGYTDWLRGLDDAQLDELLRRRPDLASPSPVTFASLAVRATGRTSTERALSGVDAVGLQVLEAAVVLPGADVEALTAAIGGDDPDAPAAVRAAVATLGSLGLLVEEAPPGPAASRAVDPAAVLAVDPGTPGLVPAPGVADAFGPYPAGLAPLEPAVDAATPGHLSELLAEAPPAASGVLTALAWGPPLGARPAPATPAASAVRWLIDQGLLVPVPGERVVLPRPVAWELRGHRTHRGLARPPVATTGTPVPAATVVAESVRAAEGVVGLVAALIDAWAAPPPALRSGGLGVRELRHTAATLSVDESTVAFLVELAAAAGLVAYDAGGPEPAFAPTDDADVWLAADLGARWDRLARAWLASTRASWLVGTRDDKGQARPALGPASHRTWLPTVRRAVLGTLAALPPDTAVGTAEVVRALTWAAPRRVPPVTAVDAVLDESARLGVVGAGALTPAGRALLADDDAAAALLAGLPPAVDQVFLQADLTGVVPGRPTPRLARLLDALALPESSGGALTVRFTPASVAAGVSDGDPEALLAELGEVSVGPVPQPLAYLIRDSARRAPGVRIGAALSYLTCDDPRQLADLLALPGPAGLGLRAVAPTVLVAAASAADVAHELRRAGVAAQVRDGDGRAVDVAGPPRRVRTHTPSAPVADPAAHRAAVIARLRSNLPPVSDDGPLPTPTRSGTDPGASTLLLLREAAGRRAQVWVELVDQHGALSRRRLRPLSVDAGRLRALDAERQTELTVAVHRIASVSAARNEQVDDQEEPR